MRSPLQNPVSTTTRNWIDSFHNKSLCYWYWCNFEIFKFLRIVIESIWNSTFENIMNNICSLFWHKTKCVERLLCTHISNDICDNIEFFWRYSDMANWSFHKIWVIKWKVIKLSSKNFLHTWELYTWKLFVSRVTHESSCKRKFTKFVSNHIFSNEYWDMRFSIMYTKSVSYKFWNNRTWTRPCLDNCFLSRSIECFNFLRYTKINVRSFFETASHNYWVRKL